MTRLILSADIDMTLTLTEYGWFLTRFDFDCADFGFGPRRVAMETAAYSLEPLLTVWKPLLTVGKPLLTVWKPLLAVRKPLLTGCKLS